MSELTELIGTHGALLARIDATDYLAVRVVYAVGAGAAPLLYCVEADWSTTQAARLADLLRVNSELRDRVAELEAKLATRQPPPPRPAPEGGKIPCDVPGCLDWIKPRGMAAHKRQAHQVSIMGTPVHRKCPHCNARPTMDGLQAHIAREHPTIAASIPLIMEHANDLGWRCAESGCAGAFTRDLHDPAHCTQHAMRSTNGHAAEVMP